MANEIYSKEVALEVDMGFPAAADWKLVVCTISKTLDKTMGTTTLNNDCNPDFIRELPTDGSWTMSIEGNINNSPSVNQISSNELNEMQDDKDIKPWRLRNGDDSYYRQGLAFLNSANETGSVGEYLTFSIGLTGTAPLIYAPST